MAWAILTIDRPGAMAKGAGIIAYNCSHEEATAQEFSLLQQDPCPNFRARRSFSEKEERVQLLQKKEFTSVHGFGARIVRTLHILPCSGTPATMSVTQRVLEVTKKEVMKIYRDGLWADIYLNAINGPIDRLEYNGTTNLDRNVIGWTDRGEYCGGEDFVVHGSRYKDTVLQASYEVFLYDALMTVDLGNNLVKTFSGTTCEYTQGHCIDIVYGDIFWSTEEVDIHACDPETYVILYEGPSIIRTYEGTGLTSETSIVTVAQDEFSFSLVRKEKVLLCGQPAYKSEHPKLYLVSLRENMRFFTHKRLHVLDLDLDAYRDSKFIHLERHMGQALGEMNANVMHKVCQIQGQIVANLQSLAMSDTLEFAYAWRKAPGHTALVRGEVVHVVNCVPVRVTIATINYCTHQLPVTYLGEAMFMHPRSHVLSRHVEGVPCTPLYPVKYKLQGVWYALGPNLVASQAPKALRLKVNVSDWSYKHLSIGTSGIYSAADISRQRSAVLFPVEQKAITRQIANTAAGYLNGPRSFNLEALVSPDVIDQALSSYWQKVNQGIRIFGIYSGVVLGIGMIYRCLMGLCEGTLHFSVLKSMFGKFTALLGCICPAIAHYAVLYGREEQKRKNVSKVSAREVFRAYRRYGNTERIDDEGERANAKKLAVDVIQTGTTVRYPTLPLFSEGSDRYGPTEGIIGAKEEQEPNWKA